MDQISQIKQQLNITDVIGGYVELKKAGRNYKGVCPFHSENTPSFMVSPDIQIFKCFGCGESGDIFEFIQKIEGVDFTKALDMLAEKAGIKLETRKLDPNSQKKKKIYEMNEVATVFFHHLLVNHKIGKSGLHYIKLQRGLAPQTIKDFKLGVIPEAWDLLYKYLRGKGYSDEEIEMAGLAVKSKRGTYIDKFRNRIIFPLIDVDNRIVGFTGRALDDNPAKYLNSPETLIFHKSSYVFGLDKAKVALKKEGAIFVEGQMDVITAHQAGITNVVASSGTALTAQQLKLLSRYTNIITFCFDPDSAGMGATYRAIELADKQGFEIKVALVPQDFADIDDLLRKDKRKAKKILEEAVPAYDFFIHASLQKFDKDSAYGKKKIAEDLFPRFAKISSPVVKDHYSKRAADLLQLSEEMVRKLISAEKSIPDVFDVVPSKAAPIAQQDNRSTEDYLLALILNAKLELAQNILYKLGKKDFTNEVNHDLFVELKEYIRPRKRQFKVKDFIKKLNSDQQKKAEELYLWDLEDLNESDSYLEKEITAIFRRLKKDTINRELNTLQKEIKAAELENNSEKLEELSKKVYKISRLKKKYE